MRCLGATPPPAGGALRFEFRSSLASPPARSGSCSATAAQLGIAAFLAGLLQAELPPPGPLSRSARISVGLVLLLGFALPPLLQLKNVPQFE